MSNHMPIKQTMSKKWTKSWKSITFQTEQKKVENMSRPITSMDIKAVIKKKFPTKTKTKKNQDQMAS